MFIERILDLFAIVTLGLAAGFVSFRSGLPADVQIVFAIGVVFVLVLAGGLMTMRNFGRRILTRLPLPHRILEFYDRFEEGVFGSIGLRALPRLVVITGFIWATEAMRLYLVVQALGLPGRPPRHQRRVLRGPRRVAADRRAADAGRDRLRRGRRRRAADDRLRRPADRRAGDHARRSGDQRALDHRDRLGRLRVLVEAEGTRASRPRPRPRRASPAAAGVRRPSIRAQRHAYRHMGPRSCAADARPPHRTSAHPTEPHGTL